MKHVGKYGVEGLISLSDEAWDAGKQLIEHSDDYKSLLKEPAAGDNIGIMLRPKGTSKDINNYRKTFFDEYPELEGSVIVHHAIEQQVLKKKSKSVYT